MTSSTPNSAVNTSSNSVTFLSQLTDFGLIKISGPDRYKLMQGQMSTKIEDLSSLPASSCSDEKTILTANSLSLSAICNPKGRCVSLFFVTQTEEVIYLLMLKDCIESSLANLKKYAVFYKVEIADCSEQYDFYGVLEPQKHEKNHPNHLSTSDLANNISSLFHYATWLEKSLAILITNKTTLNFNGQTSLQFATQSDWLYALAMRGVPWLTQETQEEFLPHNLNLPKLGAVDFKKGCFTGQEVIARMQYKGKLKTSMQLFHLDQSDQAQANQAQSNQAQANQAQTSRAQAIDAKPLQNLMCEKETNENGALEIAGQVICSATNAQQQTAVLVLLKDAYLEYKNFTLDGENSPILELIKVTD